MRKPARRFVIPFLSAVTITILACGVNVSPSSGGDQANQAATIAAYTLDAIGTDAAVAQTLTAVAPAPSTPTTQILVTLPAAPDPGASSGGGTQKPTVITSTLCWLGPGNAYEVSSSVSSGTQVDLIGKGSIAGWWIITNPIYHDPCWLMADTLQIDPSFDTSTLKIYYPPATATPTPLPTFTPTP